MQCIHEVNQHKLQPVRATHRTRRNERRERIGQNMAGEIKMKEANTATVKEDALDVEKHNIKTLELGNTPILLKFDTGADTTLINCRTYKAPRRTSKVSTLF